MLILEKFSQVSELLNLLYDITIELILENTEHRLAANAAVSGVNSEKSAL